MPQFDRATIRWGLEVLGFAALLIACALHSWTWDAVGIGILVLSVFIEPPAAIAQVVFTEAAKIKAAALAGLLIVAPIKRAEREMQMAFTFAYPPEGGLRPGFAYERCVWAEKPCGTPSRINGWGDCH